MANLQYPVNLENPPEYIFAISTSEQNLPNGKKLPKGTKFKGTLSKEGQKFLIYFNSIQIAGKNNEEPFSGKTTLDIKGQEPTNGVSAKISKTISQQTKTNVLGAIFQNKPSNIENLPNSVLSRGTILNIETN